MEWALTDVVPGDAIVVRRLLAELDAVAIEFRGEAYTPEPRALASR